jgi:hypothetical protein
LATTIRQFFAEINPPSPGWLQAHASVNLAKGQHLSETWKVESVDPLHVGSKSGRQGSRGI